MAICSTYNYNGQLLTKEELQKQLLSEASFLDKLALVSGQETTLLHEITHAFVDILEANNAELLDSLYSEFIKTKEGKKIKELVDKYYKESEAVKKKEVLTRAISEEAAGQLNERKNKNIVQRFWDYIRRLIFPFSVNKIDGNTTLAELTKQYLESRKLVERVPVNPEQIRQYEKTKNATTKQAETLAKLDKKAEDNYTSVTKVITEVSNNDIKTVFNKEELIDRKRKQIENNPSINKPDAYRMLDEEIARWDVVEKLGTEYHKMLEDAFNGNAVNNQAVTDIVKKIKDKYKNRNVIFYPERPIVLSSKKLSGRIDLMVILEDGSVDIYDYKFSDTTLADWSQQKSVKTNYQLALYKNMLRANGILPNKLYVMSGELDEQNQFTSSINEITLYESSEVVKNVNKYLPSDHNENGIFSNSNKIDNTWDFLNKFFGIVRPVASEINITDAAIEVFLKKHTFGFTDLTKSGKERTFVSFKHLSESQIKNTVRDYLTRLEEAKRQLPKLGKAYIESKRYIVANPDDKSVKPTSFASEYTSSADEVFIDSILEKYWNDYYITTKKDGSKEYTFVWEQLNSPELNELGLQVWFNTKTKVMDIISYTSKNPNDLIGIGETIGSKVMSERDATKLDLLAATEGNIEFIKGVLFILENQDTLLKGEYKIGSLSVVSTNNTAYTPKAYSQVYDSLKTLSNNSDVTSPLLQNMFKKDAGAKFKITAEHRIAILTQYYQNLFTRASAVDSDKTRKVLRKELLTRDEQAASERASMATIQKLASDRLNFLLKSKEKANGILDKESEQELKLLADVIYSISRGSILVDERDLSYFQKYTMQPDEQRSKVFRELRDIVMEARHKIEEDAKGLIKESSPFFTEVHNQFNKFQKLDVQKVYRNFYEFEEINGKIVNTFRLRDPNDDTYEYSKFDQSPLTKAEKELISYLIDQFKKQKGMRNSEILVDNENNRKRWREIPIMQSSYMKRLKGRIKEKGLKDSLTNTMKEYMADIKGDVSGSNMHQDSEIIQFNNYFAYQEAGNNRDQVLAEMQSEGDVDLDLETTFYVYSMASFKEHRYNEILPVVNSLKILLHFVGNKTGAFKDLEKLITEYIEHTIIGKAIASDDDTKPIANALNALKQGVSTALLGLSPKTGMIQFLTSLFSSISGALGIASDRFGLAEFVRAGAFVANSKLDPETIQFIDDLSYEYGIDKLEVENLITKLRNRKDFGTYFSQMAMWLNTAPDIFFRRIIFIAEALRDGTIVIKNNKIDNENSAIGFVDGKLTYKPELDKRYKKGFEDNKSEEWALYNHVKKVHEDEGNIIDGKPKLAYTRRELDSKRKIANDLYADMSYENRSWFEKTIVGVLWMQFKRWVMPIMNRYYTWGKNPLKQIDASGKWAIVKNKNGEIEYDESGQPLVMWKGRLHEGILNTFFWYISQSYKQKQLLGSGDLDDIQKRNIRHLASDLTMFLLVRLLILALDDEEKDRNSLSSKTLNILATSTKDLFFMNTVYNFYIGQNSFVTASFLDTMVHDVFGNILQGNFEQGGRSLGKTLGLTRFALEVYDVHDYYN